MSGTCIVAITASGEYFVFDSADDLFESADHTVTHSGDPVSREWLHEQLSSGPVEWLKADYLTFESVHLATKITP